MADQAGTAQAAQNTQEGGDATAETTKTSGYYRHYVLAILTAVYMVSFIDRYVVSIVTEPIKEHFQIGDAWLGILSGLGFAIFYAGLGMPIAYLADRMNRRNIIAISLAVFSAATILCGAAVQFWHLLLARLMVGVGEAGTSPPSHSIISDYYKPEERGLAMGVFAMGLNLGLLLAYLIGGWITEVYGWRYTFLAAGLPGLFLTVLMFATVREPVRGAMEVKPTEPAPPAFSVVTYLLKRPTFIHFAIGGALNAFVGYGASQWAAPFLIRAHEMSLSQVGLAMGLIYGIAGGLGTFGGGAISGMLSKYDVRWYLWFPALMILFAAPFSLAFYLLPSLPWALGFYLIPAAVGAIYLAPMLAVTQTLVPPAMRSTTSAILLFITNIIGLALGPTAVGILSDIINPMIDVGARTGVEATAYATAQGLRWSLVICSFVGLWSALHFYLASRSLKHDLSRVGQ